MQLVFYDHIISNYVVRVISMELGQLYEIYTSVNKSPNAKPYKMLNVCPISAMYCILYRSDKSSNYICYATSANRAPR